MRTVKFQLEALTCPSCIKKIETRLNKDSAVEKAEVLFNSSKVKATFDEGKTSVEELENLIEKLGYPVLSRINVK